MEKFVIYRDTVSSQESMLNTLAKTNEIKHINKYDNLNRLVAKEIKTDTKTFNQSYTYDNNGNLSKIERLDSNDNVLSTTDYNRLASNSYKLTSVTGDINATLSYGSGFNPTNITINGVSRNITYEGKRIKTYGNNTYFYNEQGIRVKKVSEDGYTKEYILEGNKILCEKILKLNNESNTYSLIGQLFYHYDLNNELVSVENEGNIYFYVKDLLGVIHKIVDVNGNTVVQYIYDSWGKLINSYYGSVGAFVAQYNPFIYKSYYYDKETKLYYLNSRFYSPELKQFLTIDDINYLDESLGNMNLFSYCNNNPIMMVDPSGHFPWLVLAIISGVLIAGGATLGGVSAGVTGGDVGDIFAGIGKGALNGLILSAGICLAVGGFSLGWSTIAGSHLLTYGVSISSNMLEVAVTQGKKSYYDGDGFWASVNDVNNAMFANSFSIVTGKFSEESITVYGTRLFTKGFKTFKFFETVAYSAQYVKFSNAFLTELNPFWTQKANPIGLAIGYIVTAAQVNNLFKAIFSKPDFENSRWILY